MVSAIEKICRALFYLNLVASYGLSDRGADSCGNQVSMTQAYIGLLQSSSTRFHSGRNGREDTPADIRPFPTSPLDNVGYHDAELLATSPGKQGTLGSKLSLVSIASFSSRPTFGLRFSRISLACIAFMVLVGICSIALCSVRGSVDSSSQRSAELLLQSKGDPRYYGHSSPPISQKQQTASRRLSGRNVESAQQGASSDEGCDRRNLQFCPDLVVPAGSECILALPMDTQWSRSRFSVSDIRGNTVLIVKPSVISNLWTSTIATANGDVLATCGETILPGASTSFELKRAGKQSWAKLAYRLEDDRYLLTPSHGVVWHFWGNFDNYMINITDETNRLFATTELGPVEYDDSKQYCRLRVAPETDVGLALCGILCIGHHLSKQQKRSRS